MSTPTPPATAQQENFLQILQMSSSELSDRQIELGLSDDGDKATKQARLLSAALLYIPVHPYQYIYSCYIYRYTHTSIYI